MYSCVPCVCACVYVRSFTRNSFLQNVAGCSPARFFFLFLFRWAGAPTKIKRSSDKESASSHAQIEPLVSAWHGRCEMGPNKGRNRVVWNHHDLTKRGTRGTFETRCARLLAVSTTQDE